MKYKLINKTTGEENICEKVVRGGLDYYLSDEPIKIGEKGISINNAIYTHFEHLDSDYGKKIIAINFDKIDLMLTTHTLSDISDLPKVVKDDNKTLYYE